MSITFSAGAGYDFGTVIFSEQDIIDFALANDPLEFHTNREVAKKHLFKGLVASGKQAFHHFHIKHWIPKFGSSVICGLSVHNWNFLKPIYANQSIHCKVTISEMTQHAEKGSASIKWKYEFIDSHGAHFQQLEMTVLHKMNDRN
ncbi:MAG TPA: MaoC/PaaZ C-terminal domain-containing protein [Bacteroidia bacterium]|nr:MaoC/PaaZ C-terminal domain-containing protein [Bacteroidia bacterium]